MPEGVQTVLSERRGPLSLPARALVVSCGRPRRSRRARPPPGARPRVAGGEPPCRRTSESLPAGASALAGGCELARSRGVKYRTVAYRDWHYDLPALAAAINENTKIVYLANPNNPTGTIFTKHQFDEFYKHVPERVLIILDEAYFEYAKDNPRYPDSMHYRYDNVITLRTFSKAYGLAGARIGYGFAHEELIRNLLKVKLPFEPSTPAQAAGVAALTDKEFLHRSLELNARGLRLLAAGLAEMGLTVVPSEANFVMTVLSSEQEALRIFEELLSQGVVVRPLKAFGLPNCLRISTGTDEDNSLALHAFRRSYATSIGAPGAG